MTSIYEGKYFCLFSLFIRWNLPNHGASCHAFGTFEKPSMKRMGASSGFHNVSTYGGEVIEYWTIFSLKIHVNQKKKLIGEFGCTLSVFGKPLVNGI
jgi:hypothetical protein